MKLDFKYIKQALLEYNAKSELKQASIIMVRNIFEQAEKKQLTLTDVVKSFVCDIDKGIRCEGSIADYKDGKCKICGQQAN